MVLSTPIMCQVDTGMYYLTCMGHVYTSTWKIKNQNAKLILTMVQVDHHRATQSGNLHVVVDNVTTQIL